MAARPPPAPPARALLLALAGALLAPPAARGKSPSPGGPPAAPRPSSPARRPGPSAGCRASPGGTSRGSGREGGDAEPRGGERGRVQGSPSSLRCQFPGGGGNTWLGARKTPAGSPDGTASGLVPLPSPFGCTLPRCPRLDSYTCRSG